MTAQFQHPRNCSVPHHIPQGWTDDGMPVIVIPKPAHEAVLGRVYHFQAELTLDATYVIDRQTFRVAHATGLIDVENREANAFDRIAYSNVGDSSAKLGDVSDGLAALRTRLLARQS